MANYHYNGVTARLRELAVQAVGTTGMGEDQKGKPGPRDLRYAFPLRVQAEHIENGVPGNPESCAYALCATSTGAAAAAYMMDDVGYVLLQGEDGKYRWWRGEWRSDGPAAGFTKRFDKDKGSPDLGPHGRILHPPTPQRRLATMRRRSKHVASEVKGGQRAPDKSRHKMPAFAGSGYVAPRGSELRKVA